MGDIADDIALSGDMFEDAILSNLDRELEWRDGLHTTRDGIQIKLKEMTIDHLINTIRYFKGLDTSPLEKELKSRNIK